MSAAGQASRDARTALDTRIRAYVDPALVAAVGALAALGLVMVASASVGIADSATGDPLYYFKRQAVFLGVGIIAIAGIYQVRLAYWARAGRALMALGLFLLILVVIPGLGHSVNGASRWLPFGAFSLQVSELAKLFAIVYVADYLVRQGSAARTSWNGLVTPLAVLGAACVLLLLEPDFGAAAVLLATALGMLFLGGVRLWRFAALLLAAGGAMAVLIVHSPYRLERLTAFVNPWADPYDSGFQLTQALIAIGGGSWLGAGLGESIQKLFYLPEAHTDFLFAVLAEELGLVGVVTVIALYGLLVWRCFAIGQAAEAAGLRFAGYLAYGVGLWLGQQALINIGVNMGMLPTKGLTLPLMSAGGSSILAACLGLGLVTRVYREARSAGSEGRGARLAPA